MKIKKKSIFIDENQGIQKNGKAFGFIGTNAIDDYQGWFFTWPYDYELITNVKERNEVIDSLEIDETCPNDEKINYRFAKKKLESYLKSKFDLRRKQSFK